MTATPSQLSSPSARRHVALSLTLGSLNRNFTAHCVALVRPNSIFPALISALSDFPALFAPLTRENPHEEIEGKIELRKIPYVIHISEHRQYDQRCLERIRRCLEQQLGRSPEMEEIAAAMDISLQQLRNIYELPQQPLSLDVTGRGEDGPGEPLEQVVSARALDGSTPKSVEDTIVETLDRKKIRVLLDHLVCQKKVKPRDKQIFSRYNGLRGPKEETFKSLGIEFGLTREGIRQINKKVLGRLRECVNGNPEEEKR